MPLLHRAWGNPMFSFLARWWFKSPLHDVYCGMRAFRKDTYYILDQRCTGMEFATEMIIKASLYKARIAEVPITLHPDGASIMLLICVPSPTAGARYGFFFFSPPPG